MLISRRILMLIQGEILLLKRKFSHHRKKKETFASTIYLTRMSTNNFVECFENDVNFTDD